MLHDPFQNLLTYAGTFTNLRTPSVVRQGVDSIAQAFKLLSCGFGNHFGGVIYTTHGGDDPQLISRTCLPSGSRITEECVSDIPRNLLCIGCRVVCVGDDAAQTGLHGVGMYPTSSGDRFGGYSD